MDRPAPGTDPSPASLVLLAVPTDRSFTVTENRGRARGKHNSQNQLTVSADSRSNEGPVSTSDQAEVEQEEGSGDGPVHIACIEELPASRDSGPALAGEHGEVRHCGETADEDIALIVNLLALGRPRARDENDGRHGQDEERDCQGAHDGGAHFFDGRAGGRSEALRGELLEHLRFAGRWQQKAGNTAALAQQKL